RRHTLVQSVDQNLRITLGVNDFTGEPELRQNSSQRLGVDTIVSGVAPPTVNVATVAPVRVRVPTDEVVERVRADTGPEGRRRNEQRGKLAAQVAQLSIIQNPNRRTERTVSRNLGRDFSGG